MEEPTMAYTMEQFIHDTHQQLLHSMTAQERLELLDLIPPEEVFQRFTLEDRLRGLDAEDLNKLKEYLKTLH